MRLKTLTHSLLILAATVAVMPAIANAVAAQSAQIPDTLEPGTAISISRQTFDIPAQPLVQALRQFADQTGLQLAVETAITTGQTSPEVKGQFSREQALQRLLEGTGLRFDFLDNRTVAVSPISKTTADASQASALRLAQTDPNSSSSTDSPQGNPENKNPESPPKDSKVEELGEVVVTGSRIARPEYYSPGPVAVLTEAEIEATGEGRTIDLLQRLSQFGPGLGPQNKDHPFTPVETGGEFLNLRGLGVGRTLVLVNGQRRVSGATTFSGVDVSTVPANMIKRVEIVTGGAAAIYGADAVTGVVNLLLKDDVDGLELGTRQSTTDRGDAYGYSYEALFGGAMGDRGRFTVGATYNHDGKVWNRDRAFSANHPNLLPNPADTGPNDGIYDLLVFHDTRIPDWSNTGTFSVDNTGARYTYDGGLRPIQNGAYHPDGWASGGGDGLNGDEFSQLVSPSSTVASLASASYDVTDNIRFTTELNFGRTKATACCSPFVLFPTLTLDNPLVPDDVKALMVDAGVSSITVGKVLKDVGFAELDSARTTYTGVAGLDGDLGEKFKWRAFAQFGRFENRGRTRNEVLLNRYAQATDAVSDPVTGDPVCRINVDLDPANDDAACRPIAVLGLDAANTTPAGKEYVKYEANSFASNKQSVFGAQISGESFNLPGGPLALVAGLEYRKDTLFTRGDPLALAGMTGIGLGKNQDASVTVKEGFAEVSAPLLSDVPFANYLEVNGAVRLSDYSTGINTTTWKLGTVYAPIQDLRVRGTLSRSVRAPNLIELFDPGAIIPIFVTDPCDAANIDLNSNRPANCAALGLAPGYASPPSPGFQPVTLVSGNPDLQPEKSDAFTVGLVFQPRFIRGFNLSVDYWDFDISGAVSQLGPEAIWNGCVDGPALDPLLCSQVERRADGVIMSVKQQPLNFAAYKARGIDLGLDYATAAKTLWNRPLSFQFTLLGSLNLRNRYISDPQLSLVTENLGSLAMPRVRATLNSTAILGPARVTWTMRYIHDVKACLPCNADAWEINNVPARVYNDLFFNADLTDGLHIGLGINNVFDKLPRYGDSAGAGYYDVYGRRLFLNIGLKF